MSGAKLLFPEMRFFSFSPNMAPKREPKRSNMKLEIIFCRSLGGSVLEKGGARKRFTHGFLRGGGGNRMGGFRRVKISNTTV